MKMLKMVTVALTFITCIAVGAVHGSSDSEHISVPTPTDEEKANELVRMNPIWDTVDNLENQSTALLETKLDGQKKRWFNGKCHKQPRDNLDRLCESRMVLIDHIITELSSRVGG